jgi:hypothetical protein
VRLAAPSIDWYCHPERINIIKFANLQEPSNKRSSKLPKVVKKNYLATQLLLS